MQQNSKTLANSSQREDKKRNIFLYRRFQDLIINREEGIINREYQEQSKKGINCLKIVHATDSKSFFFNGCSMPYRGFKPSYSGTDPNSDTQPNHDQSHLSPTTQGIGQNNKEKNEKLHRNVKQ